MVCYSSLQVAWLESAGVPVRLDSSMGLLAGLIWIHASMQNHILPSSMQLHHRLCQQRRPAKQNPLHCLSPKPVFVRELDFCSEHEHSFCMAARHSHTPCSAAGEIKVSR